MNKDILAQATANLKLFHAIFDAGAEWALNNVADTNLVTKQQLQNNDTYKWDRDSNIKRLLSSQYKTF